MAAPIAMTQNRIPPMKSTAVTTRETMPIVFAVRAESRACCVWPEAHSPLTCDAFTIEMIPKIAPISVQLRTAMTVPTMPRTMWLSGVGPYGDAYPPPYIGAPYGWPYAG